MIRRRSINGALCNFLGTLTSRYSDFDGYWVLGLIVADLRAATVDLLSDSNDAADSAPMAAFIRIARQRFHEQVAKQRLPPSFMGSACLEIARSPTPLAEGHVNGHVRRGYEVTFTARVESDLQRTYTSKMSVFVIRRQLVEGLRWRVRDGRFERLRKHLRTARSPCARRHCRQAASDSTTEPARRGRERRRGVRAPSHSVPASLVRAQVLERLWRRQRLSAGKWGRGGGTYTRFRRVDVEIHASSRVEG
jgi:hypothetical protein